MENKSNRTRATGKFTPSAVTKRDRVFGNTNAHCWNTWRFPNRLNPVRVTRTKRKYANLFEIEIRKLFSSLRDSTRGFAFNPNQPALCGIRPNGMERVRRPAAVTVLYGRCCLCCCCLSVFAKIFAIQVARRRRLSDANTPIAFNPRIPAACPRALR